MAVTPNYSWPVPVNTDLVKDGAEAIKDLGDAIDATVFGLPAGGLTLISNTALTGSSVSINNCFSATYKNYRMILNLLPDATNAQIRIKFRTAGADNSSNIYYFNNLLFTTGTTSSLNSGAPQTYTVVTEALGGGISTMSIDIINPFPAEKTTMSGSGAYEVRGLQHFTYFNGATSFDGLTISTAGSFTSGNLRIYGYKD